ncbi:flagellin N-terminal helical domain-containing protein [Rhizobium sp. LEGMi198b]|uniref:flagellin N-terminal helical domain-containing protein n=1 Tax=unclassified Rhizobium TaxID=2613769 RepID=UPI000CDF3696|nr:MULTISPECIES: flagellin [Rhizobium]AVA20336.1 flagellin C 4 [Rhizobium sp. NXC24]MDK4740543.1 flagellin [Rhizobium sp. CNPSo 3464]UWU21627.1 flagellin [Rhizobium tropici]WFU02445.1 flagellin [Rhizobium sp. CB3171]
MSSVTTNPASLAALTVLRGVNKDLGVVQQQVSSGLRVENAGDDPTYWSMSKTMQSDQSSLSTITDALGLGASKVDTASTAMDSVVDLVTQIQAKLVSAKEPGTDKSAVNADIEQLKNQLQSVTQSASFSGENWLYNTDAQPDTEQSVISNFTRGTSGQVNLVTIDYDSSQTLMIDTADASRGLLTKNIDASTFDSSGTSTERNYYLLAADSGTPPDDGTEISISDSTTDDEITDMINVTNSILKSVTSADSTLGVMKSRIDDQTDYISNLSDAVKTSVGNLVDTNMEEASARQSALQTAQQMGIQALSIANTMASKVLILLQAK